MILTDTYYPGWTAYLDGASIPIYRADGVFRAVIVPSGDHFLTFRYRALMFQRGLLIAAVGATGTAALQLHRSRQNRGSEK